MLKTLIAALAIAMFVAPLALAQDDKPADDDKKTEAKEAKKADAEEKTPEQLAKEAEKAEKLLKRAYIRVNSAEAKGLKKFKADADITADASAMGMGKVPFPGTLKWASGQGADWEAVDSDDGTNPFAGISSMVKAIFEPYLAYVVGFEAWESRFKDAKFALGEADVDEDGEKISDVIVVTHVKPLPEDAEKDAEPETEEISYAVAKNKVIWIKQPVVVQEQEAILKLEYEYEDKGKSLRLSKITGNTEVQMEGMPNDPKNPGVPPASVGITGSIEVKKHGKVGEFEIATELEGALKLMGRDIPATLTITNAQVNDDVKDDEDEEEPEDGEPEGDKPDDDEF
ncbi:MAG: hypothetical protein ACYTDT_14015 [Planctomycetota bacterium]|jgi:Ni/Co efflux regulator RcnB